MSSAYFPIPLALLFAPPPPKSLRPLLCSSSHRAVTYFLHEIRSIFPLLGASSRFRESVEPSSRGNKDTEREREREGEREREKERGSVTKCNSRYASGTPIALEKIKERQSIVVIARGWGKEGEVSSRCTPSRGLVLVSLAREVYAVHLLSRSLTLKSHYSPRSATASFGSLQCVSRKKPCCLVLVVCCFFSPSQIWRCSDNFIVAAVDRGRTHPRRF